jgi:pyruvate,water dikinase
MTEQDEKKYMGWLKLYNRENLAEVGIKNAVLGEMKQIGLPVPPGFFLTSKTFRNALAHNNVNNKILKITSDVDPYNEDSVNRAARSIKEIIESNGMPAELENRIISLYESFSKHHSEGSELSVSVRPSLVIGEGADVPLAGQLDAYTGVKGKDVIPSILKCWASLFSPGAITTFLKTGIPYDEVSLSLCVQQFVNAKTSGSALNLSVDDQGRIKMEIRGSWGMTVHAPPPGMGTDLWHVDKATLEIVTSEIGTKNMEYLPDHKTGRVMLSDLPKDRTNLPCLTIDEVTEIARVGIKVEEHFGKIGEIEWVVDKDLNFPKNIFLLQCYVNID